MQPVCGIDIDKSIAEKWDYLFKVAGWIIVEELLCGLYHGVVCVAIVKR